MKSNPIQGIYFLFILFCFHVSTSNAQEKIRFGKPVMTDLQMKAYDRDSSAQAVILFDKGYFNSDEFSFTRHVRLKVLKKGGTGFSNFVINAPSKGNIEGYTYNLENGEIVTSKLQKSNIFNEKIIDGFEVYKVFFPNVKEGSVVELRYSYRGLPTEWRFQETIPVVYNEITLEPTNYVKYKKIMYGSALVESKGHTKWVAKNVPAITEEPLMNHYSNYLTKFKIDLEQITAPGYYREFSTSWSKVGQRLMEFENFGGVIRESYFLNEKAHELKKSSDPPIEKFQKAIDFITQNIKWSQSNSLYASPGFRENFKRNHTGNSAEVNLLLISLLNKAGFKAYPMILSTRDNGLLNPIIASISGPNYVLGYIKDGDRDIFMDATSPHSVPGVLPLRCRNMFGYVIIDETSGFWVDLSKGMGHVKRQYINITCNDDHQFFADVMDSYEDYEFLEWMKEYEAAGSDESYVKELGSHADHYGMETCSISLVNKAKLKSSVKKTINLNATDNVQDLGNEIIINPFILNDFSNPFKSETRTFPIDFVCPKKKSVVVTFKIPPQYTLRNIPEPMVIGLENGGVKFSYRTVLNNDILNIKCDLQVDSQIFSEADYPAIRNFFISVNRKMAELIQIDKKI